MSGGETRESRSLISKLFDTLTTNMSALAELVVAVYGPVYPGIQELATSLAEEIVSGLFAQLSGTPEE